MKTNLKDIDLCVVGGAGHVGLPLSIKFADKGLKVCSYDIDDKTLKNVKNGIMPFIENDAEKTVGYKFLSKIIKTGCKTAIAISKKI